MKANELLTHGPPSNTFGPAICDFTRATETAGESWWPVPQDVLQSKDECEIQSVLTPDVLDRSMRMEAEVVPKIPSTCNIELPVDAAILGNKLVTPGEKDKLKILPPSPNHVLLESQTETMKEDTPVSRGSRNTTAVSDAQTVEGAADL